MTTRPPLTPYALGALSALLLWTVTAAHATPQAAPPPPAGPVTHCAPGGTLRGPHGQYADIALCVTNTGTTMTVTAAATCRRGTTKIRPVCRTSGTWTAHRADSPTTEPTATGTLAGRADYPGPGTYDIDATVHVRSEPAETDLRGHVRATVTLTDAKPRPTHRIDVAVKHGALKPGTSTTLTYTVARVSDHGDGSARLGLIGEEATGIRLTSSDPRCVNPLPGRYPSTTRSMYALDCALTDLQPGRPTTVTVRATLKDACSTIVSKLGYWTPRGQESTGGMLTGPTVTCDRA
ncbi:hypothetical protein AMK26_25700 [Streptomyces sp. CB03234]|uniref:hypothetical protein n=1 Tax=Streptomyces sp. (strain CB03234) TaxID=1703937 RepID=UPI00095B9A4D|nr:hypothetical protein [Streptomyces sp. CB03234]OKJ99441.1 hypothetical protein AMK26_25700 [Streptomyces sp. CB03234]